MIGKNNMHEKNKFHGHLPFFGGKKGVQRYLFKKKMNFELIILAINQSEKNIRNSNEQVE